MMRRRRPLARAALVGGGAYYAGKKHAQGQAEDDAAEGDQEARLEALEAAAAGSRRARSGGRR